MTTQRFALEPNGSKRLVISWRGRFKNFTIKLDEQIIGSISGQDELKSGREFPLPDGSQLNVQLVGLLVRLSRDGKPIPGSPDDPARKLYLVRIIIFVTAGSNILGGLSAPLSGNFLVFGLGYLVLGYLVNRRSLPALIIAMAGIAYQMIVYTQAASFSCFSVFTFLLFIYLLITMYQGIKAIRELKTQAMQST